MAYNLPDSLGEVYNLGYVIYVTFIIDIIIIKVFTLLYTAVFKIAKVMLSCHLGSSWKLIVQACCVINSLFTLGR